jgi:hypothetical protein
MTATFHLHEDDWAMIDLVPAENAAASGAMVDEARRHGDAHRAPDGQGWKECFVAPPPQLPVAARRLTVEALAAHLGPAWHRPGEVTTGYSSLRVPVQGGFAFTAGGAALYGTATAGVVDGLHLHGRNSSPTLLEALVALGAGANLVAVDLWLDEVVDLRDAVAIARYLAER